MVRCPGEQRVVDMRKWCRHTIQTAINMYCRAILIKPSATRLSKSGPKMSAMHIGWRSESFSAVGAEVSELELLWFQFFWSWFWGQGPKELLLEPAPQCTMWTPKFWDWYSSNNEECPLLCKRDLSYKKVCLLVVIRTTKTILIWSFKRSNMFWSS